MLLFFVLYLTHVFIGEKINSLLVGAQLLERLIETAVFDRPSHVVVPPADVTVMHAKIGELMLENDFLEGALTDAGLHQRGASIQRECFFAFSMLTSEFVRIDSERGTLC